MSQISLKSLSGITSITTPAGVDDVFTVHSNDTTERFRVDSIGNLNITGNVSVAGVSTFSEDVKFDGATAGRDITFDRSVNRLNFADNADLTFGDSNDLIIVHNGNHSLIQDAGQGNLSILSDSLYLQNTSGSEVYLKALNNTGVLDLYYNNQIRLTTSNTGVTVTGTVNATSFVGSGAQLTGIVGGKFGGGATGIQTVGNVGVQTANMTAPDLVGAASSLVGLYIGDGSLLFSNNLSRTGGYYITTGVNALNAGPVTLNSALTLNGTWVIV